MPSLTLRYERDEIANTFQYGCIVEMWDSVAGVTASGSKRRKYCAEFTVEERKVISLWHRRFRKWVLVGGPPESIHFRKPYTVWLLQRAAAFFATV